MGKPKNKEEIILQSVQYWEKLEIYYRNERMQKFVFPDHLLNRNLRDLLAHIYHWQLLFLDWYEKGMLNLKPDMPAEGYSWRQTKDLNIFINKKYAGEPIDNIFKLLYNSHRQILEIVHNHSDDQLMTKKKYDWTGSTSLGAYIISATSSHYKWAIKLLKKHGDT